jgi:hypothetical protein
MLLHDERNEENGAHDRYDALIACRPSFVNAADRELTS